MEITNAGDAAKNNEKCELANGQRSEKCSVNCPTDCSVNVSIGVVSIQKNYNMVCTTTLGCHVVTSHRQCLNRLAATGLMRLHWGCDKYFFLFIAFCVALVFLWIFSQPCLDMFPVEFFLR